ncbi:SET domain-containing protein [Gloeocapsopsis sp. IPPAS B-1203]|uniref:SET domain-containing protein n=1 Tax=Gloeocapsopsis sp. IPPAS B-1203 TaxID=2049454 RepID=UPI000C1935D7|nr:SET domain-containing protein [Gloeocapsopsis sp. IPPAS B-1203]PIG94018.1 SET domain-containing protein-lysine N-methyltransferase [Gloeocapsopsis sp. IPPAS B-1203]
MIHPDTQLGFVSPSIGYGVFATKFIPQGTITWVLDKLDQEIDESYILAIDDIYRDQLLKYSFRNAQGKYILCWDIARYINHSFDANCILTPYDLVIAARDIHPGEELTEDYGLLNLDEPFDCLPETGSDRVQVTPHDILHFYHEWDQKAVDAIRLFKKVDQPLAKFINSKFLPKVNAVAAEQDQMDSVVSCYYKRSIIPSSQVNYS